MNRPGSAVQKKNVINVYRIYGLFYDPEFYLVEILVRKLHQQYTKISQNNKFEFYKLPQTQYDYYLRMLKRNFPDRRILAHERGAPLILCNGNEYIMHMGKIVEAFSKPIYQGQIYRPPELIGVIEGSQSELICHEQVQGYFSKQNFVFFTLYVSSQMILPVPQRFKVVIQLFRDVTPKSCFKFIELCLAAQNGYRGTSFHRICKNYFLQGGLIDKHRKQSLGNFEVFEDEVKNYIKHDKPGIIGFTNLGVQHSNDVQFYITFDKIPGFDGKTVVIGQALTGMRELRKLNKIQPQNSQKPIYDIKIIDSGIYQYMAEDFATKSNPQRVSTAPFLECKRPKSTNTQRLTQSLSVQENNDWPKIANDPSKVAHIEKGIMESSKFLFELSDSEADDTEQNDLVYSQNKLSIFNSFFSKNQQISKPVDIQDYTDEFVGDFLPQLKLTASQYESQIYISRQNTSKQPPIQEFDESQLISLNIKVSYVSGL